MNEIKLRQLVAEAVGLDREISLQQDRLKDLKARLVVEARSRLEEDAAPGGQAIVFSGLDGDIARVLLPAPALKSKIDAESKPLEKIKAVAGASFESLFVPSLAYVPIEGFRVEAANLLGASAPKLIKLCETESRPRVCFETKPSPAL
jgi:hypothetical protein